MTLKARLLSFSEILARQGLTEEAELTKRVAHYIPDNSTGLPSFWRRNYDYGTGFYSDMSKKPSVTKWLKKKKKSKNKKADIIFLLKRVAGDPKLRQLYEKESQLCAELSKENNVNLQLQLDNIHNEILTHTAQETSRENQLASQIREVQQLLGNTTNEVDARKYQEILTTLESELVDLQKGQRSFLMHHDLTEQAKRLVNPQSLVDYFRIALLKDDLDEVARIYRQMLPSEQEEARDISQEYHRAVCINRILRQSKTKEIVSFVTQQVKTALTFRTIMSPRGERFVAVFTPHFEQEARAQGESFDSTCMVSKLGQIFDQITTIPDVWGAHFGRSYVYFTKKFNEKPGRRRWELELHSCTPDNRFHTQNQTQAKFLDVGC